MREKLLCPVCKEHKYLNWDKEHIRKHGKCAKCLLEADLGHSYNPPTFDCECGKTFKQFKNLERHKKLYCKLKIL
jgi:uncharacterized protein YbaR (Trm112 family)